jgi:hypothetical protein
MLTDPVNSCLSVIWSPILLLPVMKITDDEINCTLSSFATMFPFTVRVVPSNLKLLSTVAFGAEPFRVIKPSFVVPVNDNNPLEPLLPPLPDEPLLPLEPELPDEPLLPLEPELPLLPPLPLVPLEPLLPEEPLEPLLPPLPLEPLLPLLPLEPLLPLLPDEPELPPLPLEPLLPLEPELPLLPLEPLLPDVPDAAINTNIKGKSFAKLVVPVPKEDFNVTGKVQ